MQPTIAKIEGMQDYDLTGLGFPLYYENKLFGTVGMIFRASKVEKKTLEESIFSVDGYRKIDKIEFYEQNFNNMDFDALGLGGEIESLTRSADSIMTGIVNDLGDHMDSLAKSIDLEGLLDDFGDFFSDEDEASK